MYNGIIVCEKRQNLEGNDSFASLVLERREGERGQRPLRAGTVAKCLFWEAFMSLCTSMRVFHL